MFALPLCLTGWSKQLKRNTSGPICPFAENSSLVAELQLHSKSLVAEQQLYLKSLVAEQQLCSERMAIELALELVLLVIDLVLQEVQGNFLGRGMSTTIAQLSPFQVLQPSRFL